MFDLIHQRDIMSFKTEEKKEMDHVFMLINCRMELG